MPHARLRLALIALSLLPALAFGQDSPLGRWRSIDDATGKPKAVIEIADAGNGTLSARIVKLLDLKDGPNPVCKACKGQRHGQPMVGMVIAWGLKPEDGSWGGGRIFDLQGNYDLMWWISIALGLVSAALHYPIVEERLTRPAQPALQPA